MLPACVGAFAVLASAVVFFYALHYFFISWVESRRTPLQVHDSPVTAVDMDKMISGLLLQCSPQLRLVLTRTSKIAMRLALTIHL